MPKIPMIRNRSNPAEDVPEVAEATVQAPTPGVAAAARSSPMPPIPISPGMSMYTPEQMEKLFQAELQRKQAESIAIMNGNYRQPAPRVATGAPAAPRMSAVVQLKQQLTEMAQMQDAVAGLVKPNPMDSFLNSGFASKIGEGVASLMQQGVQAMRERSSQKAAIENAAAWATQVERGYAAYNKSIELQLEASRSGIQVAPPPQAPPAPNMPNPGGSAMQGLINGYGQVPPAPQAPPPAYGMQPPPQPYPQAPPQYDAFGQPVAMGRSHPRTTMMPDPYAANSPAIGTPPMDPSMIPQPVPGMVPSDTNSELERLRQENEQLKAQAALGPPKSPDMTTVTVPRHAEPVANPPEVDGSDMDIVEGDAPVDPSLLVPAPAELADTAADNPAPRKRGRPRKNLSGD